MTPSTNPGEPSAGAVRAASLSQWLADKLKLAEEALRAREQAVEVWKSGTNESWAAAARMHPSTAGKPMSKAERMTAAARASRIAIKCRHDVEMIKAIIDRETGIVEAREALSAVHRLGDLIRMRTNGDEVAGRAADEIFTAAREALAKLEA